MNLKLDDCFYDSSFFKQTKLHKHENTLTYLWAAVDSI